MRYRRNLGGDAESSYRKPYSLTLLTPLGLYTSIGGIVHVELFAEFRVLNVTFLGVKVRALQCS